MKKRYLCKKCGKIYMPEGHIYNNYLVNKYTGERVEKVNRFDEELACSSCGSTFNTDNFIIYMPETFQEK